jgi:hypothetical protein
LENPLGVQCLNNTLRILLYSEEFNQILNSFFVQPSYR